MEKVREFFTRYGVLLFGVVVGCGILIYGIWSIVGDGGTKVEIIPGNETTNKLTDQQSNGITIDIEGAVEKPGVYKLPSGSRVGDALVSAGGLASSADRGWVAATLNLASEMKDGEKVYIPEKNIQKQTMGEAGLAPTESKKININTASLSELDSLSGIGAVRAKTILDNRPYSKTEDLVSKAKIPQSVYDKIKDNITIY